MYIDPAWLEKHDQIIVVSTSSWETTQGNLRCYERDGIGYQMIGEVVDVVVGLNGMAWGRGLYEICGETGPIKIEGDNKSPAGIFNLKSSFGISSKFKTKLPYFQISVATEAVDDPSSQYYNRIIENDKISHKDWNSSEKMIECLPFYNLGIVIDHNSNPPIPRCGSCIFMHVWRSNDDGTAGCTAMAESDLVKILEWLDPMANPILIQAPNINF